MEFLRKFGVTAVGAGGQGLGFDNSTLILLTSDEDQLTKNFTSVNPQLILVNGYDILLQLLNAVTKFLDFVNFGR